jgi:NADPH2:quinone reductase
MKAILCHDFSGPSGLTLEEIPDPVPGPGQIRLAVRACGINFADSLITAGKYQVKPPLPFSPGFEVSGEILEIGAGVEGFQIGDRVLGIAYVGGYAEQTVLPATQIVSIPSTMPYTHAAAFPVAYGTSHVALAHRARLKSDEALVVHGAAGGVGLTAVEIGKQLGARVIATARIRIKALTDGRGADVVYDPVGGDLFTASLRSINFEGRILVIGFAGGTVPQISANHLLVKNIAVVGLNWPAYLHRNPTVLRASLQSLLSWYAAGPPPCLGNLSLRASARGTATASGTKSHRQNRDHQSMILCTEVLNCS